MMLKKRANAAGQVSLGLGNANKRVGVVILGSGRRKSSTTKRHSWCGLLSKVAAELKVAGRPMSGAEIVRVIIKKKMWLGAVSRGPRAAKFRTDMERAIWCQVERDKSGLIKKLPTCKYTLG